MGRKLRQMLIFLFIILKLQRLYLNQNQIAVIERGALANLPQLKTLYLMNNQITMIEPATLANLSQLQKLYLNGNQIAIIEPENTSKTGTTPSLPLASTSDRPESAHSLTVRIATGGSVAGVVLVGTIFLTVWYKRGTRHPPLGLSPNVVGGNTNTAVSVMTSGDDNQYEDIDNHHDQTGQGQSQAITESNTNTTATVMTSGHDNQYEDIDNHHDQTGQGQSQVISESNKNVTAIVMTSGHDQTGQGQSQAVTESTTNTTATVMTSGHDNQYEDIDKHYKTGQGQSQAITESLDDRNLSYGTEQTASQLNSLYKVGNQSQTITESNTNTASVITNGYDQTGQDQLQAVTESVDAGNIFYGTGPTASQLNSLYENQQDHTGQGQPQTITESSDEGNASCGTGPTASQLNTLYENVAWNPSVNALSPLRSSALPSRRRNGAEIKRSRMDSRFTDGFQVHGWIPDRAEERSGDKAFKDGFQARFRRKFHTAVTMYKLLNGRCPPHLQSLLPRARASATESRKYLRGRVRNGRVLVSESRGPGFEPCHVTDLVPLSLKGTLHHFDSEHALCSPPRFSLSLCPLLFGYLTTDHKKSDTGT
ncbi:Bax inhibitor 1 [Branchiostoma belcheri]|nr:Bax inhibitor 1 [Branchiostoma belcheri]